MARRLAWEGELPARLMRTESAGGNPRSTCRLLDIDRVKRRRDTGRLCSVAVIDSSDQRLEVIGGDTKAHR